MNYRKLILVMLSIPLILLLLKCTPPSDGVLYVNSNAPADGDGTSWERAFNNLQDALDAALPGEEIWVAAGTYNPSKKVGGIDDRHKSFALKNGVSVLGGFKGYESNSGQRNWKKNPVFLSGDLNGDDENFKNNDENCYHVITGNSCDTSAVLDGFKIMAGNANADVWPDDGGGGMNNFNGSPTIRNCTFVKNAADAAGGGIRNWGENCKPLITKCNFSMNRVLQEGGGMMNGPGSRPTVLYCMFINNYAGHDGGGIYNNESFNSIIANCIFSHNFADLKGGGIYNVNSSSPKIINCTIINNTAKSAGGGISNKDADPVVSNCILWFNFSHTDSEIHNEGKSAPEISFSNITGGHAGKGNIDKDPLFAIAEFRLSSKSPCIDAGNNNAVPDILTKDFENNPRIINGVVDIGAFEKK